MLLSRFVLESVSETIATMQRREKEITDDITSLGKKMKVGIRCLYMRRLSARPLRDESDAGTDSLGRDLCATSTVSRERGGAGTGRLEGALQANGHRRDPHVLNCCNRLPT